MFNFLSKTNDLLTIKDDTLILGKDESKSYDYLQIDITALGPTSLILPSNIKNVWLFTTTPKPTGATGSTGIVGSSQTTSSIPSSIQNLLHHAIDMTEDILRDFENQKIFNDTQFEIVNCLFKTDKNKKLHKYVNTFECYLVRNIKTNTYHLLKINVSRRKTSQILHETFHIDNTICSIPNINQEIERYNELHQSICPNTLYFPSLLGKMHNNILTELLNDALSSK